MATSSKSAGTGVLSGSKAKTGSDRATLRGGIRRSASRTTALEQLVVKHDAPLSFISRTYTARGRHVSSNYFDVPAQEYSVGYRTGQLAAGEMLAHMQRDGRAFFIGILEEVGIASRENANKPSRRGAAAGFINTIDAMMSFAAKRADHERYIAENIRRQDAWERADAERLAQEKRTFAERMQAAKAAKRETGHA